ncbi:MAG: hypothetical protein E7055_19740 [Lentisphaerae bacterium]|nr:hypothetical protein [Lentisphaerota bacterium]
MKLTLKLRTAAFMAVVLSSGAVLSAAESGEVRTIHLRQDDAQVRFESKLYELKHIRAEEILPFVNSAILRYNRNSTIRRVTSDSKTGAILVSTGRDFLPHVDAIVAALDRPGKLDENDSAIAGTGLARVAYSPRYRAAADFSNIVNATIGSSTGAAYVNLETNTIFWRDQTTAAKRTLEWVKQLDRPLPQVRIRLNYYELRDSDLKDWGMDYLAWKNGPGVNLLNLGYNAGHIAVDELLQDALFVSSASWGLGGFFTAPQFDMSFIRCLQQSGNANAAASASLTMISTPVANEEEYALLQKVQDKHPNTAPFIHRIAMKPEYQNIAKNTLGRTLVGKSYYEDEDGNLHGDPPNLEAKIVNPFICFQSTDKDANAQGFIPSSKKFYHAKNELKDNGGVIFDYALYFKSVVERGNTGAELSNTALIAGAATLGFGREKVLAVYEKENDVEQTIGLPILSRLPIIKYLFSTVTTIKERTYLVVSAEAEMVHPDDNDAPTVSESRQIIRRPESVLRTEKAVKEAARKHRQNRQKKEEEKKKQDAQKKLNAQKKQDAQNKQNVQKNQEQTKR